jgi:hypothetical protein
MNPLAVELGAAAIEEATDWHDSWVRNHTGHFDVCILYSHA